MRIGIMNLTINAKQSNPDDFYLQWKDIYWWQMKFNLKLMIIGAYKEKDKLHGEFFIEKLSEE